MKQSEKAIIMSCVAMIDYTAYQLRSAKSPRTKQKYLFKIWDCLNTIRMECEK